MKLYISLDMEGLAGITHFQQEEKEQARFRQAMHNQLLWIMEGIRQSPKNDEIREIVVSDSHGGAMNLSYDELSRMDERISLISGFPRPGYMMAGCDESFDMAFLVGYHAGAGISPANMDHTFFGCFYNLRINGLLMNEASVNAAFAGSLGVPVGLIVGDSGLKMQLEKEDMMVWAGYVCTKEAIGRYAAKFRPQRALREETMAAVKEALGSDPALLPRFIISPPYRLEIEFIRSSMADAAEGLPGVKRTGGYTVEAQAEDFEDLFGYIFGCGSAAGRA